MLNYYTILPAGGFLLVPEKVVDVLDTYRQIRPGDTEAGGVLIGCWRRSTVSQKTFHVELTSCTEPSGQDYRSRYEFERRSQHHVRYVQEVWASTQGLQTYIGEWHTHPESHPEPSQVDILNWKRNLRGNIAVLAIVGTKSIWLAYWDGSKATHLPKLVEDK
ncbi:Mov34/MPN/PAD-1 family protein [Microbulbifer sp. JMSA003]|uniref:Mov34/MPN/PAD-1 family protein n=1 Tax=Microbulbifer sp. JMSA003 TaxID=3243369 RepID=UPI00403A6D78